MTDYKQLCAKVLAYYEGQGEYDFSNLGAIARDNAAFDAWHEIRNELKSALAEPDQEEEVLARVAFKDQEINFPSDLVLRQYCDDWFNSDPEREEVDPVELCRGAIELFARFGNTTPQPVPVSERLPGPEDCDGEGRCWWGEPQIGDSHDATWNLCTQDEAEDYCTWGTKCGWLPAHTLPLPTTSRSN